MMTKTKNSKKDAKNYSQYVVVVAVALAALFGILGTSLLYKQAELIGKYELLEKIDNQACRYLDGQVAVNGGFDLEASAPKDRPKLVYKCTTGEMTGAKVIHGKPIDAYEFGASVQYFSSNEAAIKYAEEKVNPLRYWGVDEEGQKNGIPQTSRFTFIVTDEKVPYFDAYTVKATAVLRVSLPCHDADIQGCHNDANTILGRELKGINVL
jgi:hypothetical protein